MNDLARDRNQAVADTMDAIRRIEAEANFCLASIHISEIQPCCLFPLSLVLF